MNPRVIQVLLIVGLGLLLLWVFFRLPGAGRTKIDYTQLVTYIQQGEVQKLVINKDAETAQGDLKPVASSEGVKLARRFQTDIPKDPSELIALATEKGVPVELTRASAWSSFFSLNSLLLMGMILIPVLFFWFLISRQMQGGGSSQAFNFGKSRARMVNPEKTRITFSDVAGLDEVVDELREVVDFLKDPTKYQRLGAEIPKGVILLGPPGSGKTLLAKAIAGEANVPFFYISGSDFVEMFVGVGAARVRDLFDQAKRRAPCLVFVDELDAVGRHRGTGIGGGHDEREQTLNQLLVEMDGFEPNSGVIVLSATNRPDVLDPALLRPGRFDRRIVVDNADAKGRENILKIHLKNKPLASDVDIAVIARRTPGFSGADLRNVANEAALLAARKNHNHVSMADLEEAVDRVLAGPERRSKVITEKERKIIAYHELGHAIVAYQLPGTDPVHKVSIIPRGLALGYTLQLPEEDTFLLSREQLLNRISVLLGGRTSEELVFGQITTGAANDFERSTELAREMVTRFGMSDELGPLTFGKKDASMFLGKALMEDRNYSEMIASKIDQEVKRIITECHQQARDVLERSREALDRIATVLIDRETLDRAEFEQLMKQYERQEEAPAPV
ncbi:MAG: cell division protein FtsH [Planctomycetales bacterium 4484_113]|nr:MAG: cell division protein FtsH [Planctomycetales bacterium 4484_113]